MHWRVYGEEGLAGREAALWLSAESLTIEHAGEPLSRYDARLASGTGELRSLTRPRLFGSSRVRPQLRLFALDALGEEAAVHAARGLRSIAYGFATLEQAGGFGMSLDPDESFRRLVRAFADGLRPEEREVQGDGTGPRG